MKKEHSNGAHRTITIPDPISVRELALALEMKPHAIIAEFMHLNMFVSLNTPVDFPAAVSLCSRYGVVAHKIV